MKRGSHFTVIKKVSGKVAQTIRSMNQDPNIA